MEATQKKRRFTMPSSFTVLFLIIIVIAILTWLIPAGEYQVDDAGNLIAGTYDQIASQPQGIWDVIMSPIHGMLGTAETSGAVEISLFILMVGGFLGIVNETGALDSGVAATVKRYKGKEKMLIPVLMILFALGGSTYGMAEETMAFYPLIVPVMIGVGFDAVVGVAIVLLGSQIGCLASTVNPFATGVASQIAGISPGEGILWRLVFLVVTLSIGIFFVYRYASKIEEDPTKSLLYHQKNENKSMKMTDNVAELTKKQLHVLVLFGLTFFMMILSLIPWEEFGVMLFVDFNNWLTSIPVLGEIIGTATMPLGEWYFQEITMLFLVMSIVVGVVFRMGEARFISAFLKGCGELLSVALIVAVARGIQVVMNSGSITATILHYGETGLGGLSAGMFAILTYIFYIPMSFLIPSTSGLAGATMGIMAPLGEFNGVQSHIVITAYQAANGLVNLISPTSAVVMGAMALSGVNIATWWRYTAKIIVVIFIASLAILWLAALLS